MTLTRRYRIIAHPKGELGRIWVAGILTLAEAERRTLRLNKMRGWSQPITFTFEMYAPTLPVDPSPRLKEYEY